MPKKILNLEEKIFDAAWKLFSNYGYDDVDMKGIAKECNIAVGTLYNYYGNKKELFIKVLGESWANTFRKIEMVDNENKSEYAIEVVKILYKDIKERRGIGANLLNSEAISKGDNKTIEQEIISKIYDYMIRMFNSQNKDESLEYKAEKLTHIILCNIVLLARLYPEDDDENIDFIVQIVENNLI